jgi:hypothetical protein
MKNKVSSAKEILLAARWILENHTWMQNDFQSFNNGKWSFCAVGAINQVKTDSRPQYQVARQLLNSVVGGSIVAYNDDEGRTKEEVLVAFDRAIAKADAHE